MSDTPSGDKVQIRRAPKIPAFMIVGGGIGAVTSFVLTNLFPVDPAVGFLALFGFFSLFTISAGVVLGAVLALVLDRRSRKRTRTVGVEVERTEAPPEDSPAE